MYILRCPPPPRKFYPWAQMCCRNPNKMLTNSDGGWGLLSRFPPFHYFLIFQYHQNTCLLLNIAYIFDRCHHSSAVVTPAIYEWDSKYVTRTFARSKSLLMEKLTNRALVNPTLSPVSHQWHQGGTSLYRFITVITPWFNQTISYC